MADRTVTVNLKAKVTEYVSSVDKAADSTDRLRDKAEKFSSRKYQAKLSVDTKGATEKVDAVERKMATLGDKRIKLDADVDVAKARIGQVQAKLEELRKQKTSAKVDADVALAEAQLEQLQARLGSLRNARVQVDADTAAAQAELAALEGQVNRLDGRTARVKVDMDKSLADQIVKVAALGRALSTLALPAAAIAATPQLAGLGAAAVTTSGALWLLPAAGAAGAAAMGTLATGLSHVADALGPTGTPAQIKKVNEAMASLSPNARAAVTEIRSLGPAWTSVRLDVQDKLFAGVSQRIDQLGSRYLPVLKTGLGGISTELNASGQSFATWADSAGVAGDISTIFDQTRAAMHELVPVGRDVAAILTDIAVVGSDRLPGLAKGLTDAADKLRTFVANARASGELGEWIDRGINALEQLGRIAGNVGGALGSIFDAANGAGVDFLGTVEKLTGKIDAFLNSDRGEAALVALFTGIGEVVDAVTPGLERLATAVANVIVKLQDSGTFRLAGEALTAIAEAAGPVLEDLGELASVVLPPLLSLVKELAPVLVPLAAGLVAMSLASKGLTALKALPTLLTGFATGATGAGTAAQGASTKIGLFTKKLGLIGVAVYAATEVLDGLSNHEVKIPDPDTAGFTSKLDSALRQVGDLFDALVDGNMERFNKKLAEAADGGGAVITLSVDDQAAWSTAQSFIEKVNRSGATIKLDGNTVPLGDAVTKVMDAIATGRPTVIIDGNPVPADTALEVLKDRINSSQPMLNINGTAVPAGDALLEILGKIKAASGTLVINGDVTPVSDALAKIQAAADAGQATVEINGNPVPVKQALDLVTAAINTANPSVNINGKGERAAAALAQVEGLIAKGGGFVTIDGHIMAAEEALQLIKGRIDNETGRLNVDANTKPAEGTYGRMVDGINTGTANLPIGVIDQVTPTVPSIIDGVNRSKARVNIDGNTVPVGTALEQAVAKISAGQGTIMINGEPKQAVQAFETLTGMINTSTPALQIGGNTIPAGQALKAVIGAVNSGNAQVQIGGNRYPVDQVMAGLVAQLNTTRASITLDANADPATGKVTGTLALANGSVGKITLDANPDPATGKVTGVVDLGNGSTATITLEGNPDPATGKVDAVIEYGNGQTTTIQVDAPTDNAADQIDAFINSYRNTTINIPVIIGGHAAGAIVRNAAGGIVAPMHDGGVLGMAGGGNVGSSRKLTPMPGGLARVVPPQTWRVVGDRVRDDEAYIPMNRSKRSKAILGVAAGEMGYDLVPKGSAQRMAAGGVAAASTMTTAAAPAMAVSLPPERMTGLEAKLGQLVALSQDNGPPSVRVYVGEEDITSRIRVVVDDTLTGVRRAYSTKRPA